MGSDLATVEPSATALIITGRTRAGKTTLATALEDSFGWPRAAFSDYIRGVADQRSVQHTREALQDLGQQLIDELSFDGFVAALFEHTRIQPRAPVVIEGARHLDTLDALARALAPDPAYVVFLRVSDAERDRRLAAEGVSSAEGARWETHSTELEVLSDFPERADLIVDADLSKAEVLRATLAWLGAA